MILAAGFLERTGGQTRLVTLCGNTRVSWASWNRQKRTRTRRDGLTSTEEFAASRVARRVCSPLLATSPHQRRLEAPPIHATPSGFSYVPFPLSVLSCHVGSRCSPSTCWLSRGDEGLMNFSSDIFPSVFFFIGFFIATGCISLDLGRGASWTFG